MPENVANEILNDLLVRAYRSLLQYTGECWPWAGADDSVEQQAVCEMAAAQKECVARMVELLQSRDWAINFGNYPDFSALHYVSLDFLLGRLVADEEDLLGLIESARDGVAGDPEGAELVSQLHDATKQHLTKLRELAAAHPVSA
jgi:hypothetical protein